MDDIPVRLREEIVDVKRDAFTIGRCELQAVADSLRGLSTRLNLQDEGDMAVFDAVEMQVASMQALCEQMDPVVFAKGIRDMRSMANVQQARTKSLPYNVAFLMKAVIMSDMLKHDADLGRALRHCLRMVLPSGLVEACENMLDASACMMPHKSTISRWRVLVDGAFMLYTRVRHAAAADQQGHIRYMMADSSTQHGRDFEHIVISSVERGSLSELHDDAMTLANMWS